MKRFYTTMALAFAGVATVGLTAKAETWKSLGECEWRENGIHGWWMYSAYPELKVEIQESEQTPGRYRLVNPYKDYPDVPGVNNYNMPGDYYVIVDASDPNAAYIETSLTGHIIGGDPNTREDLVMWISSQAYDCLTATGSLAGAIREGLVGQMREGYINFPAGTLVSTYLHKSNLETVPDFSGDYTWSICDDDMCRIHLPGAPYTQDNSVEFIGIDKALTTLTYGVTLDKDVTSARVAMFTGKYDEENIDKIVNGEVEFQEIQSSSNVTFPFIDDGIFSVYVVAYRNGKLMFSNHVTHELAEKEDVWKKMGKAYYTEAVISSCDQMKGFLTDYDEYTYEVPIERLVENPNIFRLVNPYGPTYPYYSPEYYDHTQNWYMIIDATDRDHVVIKESPMGFSTNYGTITVWSRADKYLDWGWNTREELEELGLYGKFDGTKITFPESALLVFYSKHPSPDAWYWANDSGHFLVDLTPTGVKDVAMDEADIDAPEEYFTLNGMKVNRSNLTPGIYIVRKGNKSYKQVVK